MNIEELKALSELNKEKVRTYGKESYIKFIKGKMKRRAEDGRREVVNVFENLNIILPSKLLLAEIIEEFHNEGFRVDYDDKTNFIKKISW